MAVPKRKSSRARTRSRRAQWKTVAPDLVPVSVDGATYSVPRRLVRAIQRGFIDPRSL